MSEIRLSFGEIAEELVGERLVLPRYVSFMLNRANRYAQATRPKVVGQMTELIQQCPYRTYTEWKQWYNRQKPDAIKEATRKIMGMLRNFEEAIQIIDEDMVKRWVEDLVLIQSFAGLRFQEAILKRIASISKKSYRVATPEEESKGIDGFIGDIAVSIKPETYKIERPELAEKVEAKMIYYRKAEGGIVFECNLEEF